MDVRTDVMLQASFRSSSIAQADADPRSKAVFTDKLHTYLRRVSSQLDVLHKCVPPRESRAALCAPLRAPLAGRRLAEAPPARLPRVHSQAGTGAATQQ